MQFSVESEQKSIMGNDFGLLQGNGFGIEQIGWPEEPWFLISFPHKLEKELSFSNTVLFAFTYTRLLLHL